MALNEYRAVLQFTEVVRALAVARAPLDVLGMASDFLADECAHVELASRMANELGGAVALEADLDAVIPPRRPPLTALQRANEMVIRVSTVAEAFRGGTALGCRNVTHHPPPRAVLDRILADEAHHRRLSVLYFDQAGELLDDAERRRLAQVALKALEGHARFWRFAPHRVVNGKTRQGWRIEDVHSLGWLEAEKFATLARDVVVHDILEPLARLGIVITEEERETLLRRPEA